MQAHRRSRSGRRHREQRFRGGQLVAADYACTDPDDTTDPLFVDVKTCAGPVADGAAIDTGAPGSHSFTVDGDDRAGNTASKNVTYVVDASAPQISISSPADGSRLRQGQVVLGRLRLHGRGRARGRDAGAPASPVTAHRSTRARPATRASRSSPRIGPAIRARRRCTTSSTRARRRFRSLHRRTAAPTRAARSRLPAMPARTTTGPRT